MANNLGNSIYHAAFESLLLTEKSDIRHTICIKWATILLKSSISFEQRYCTPINFLFNTIRDVTWRNPFLFVIDYSHNFTNIISALSDVITIEMPSEDGWVSPKFQADMQRSSNINSIVVVYNITTSPPLEYYQLLLREYDKDNTSINIGNNKACRYGYNKGYIFVTTENIEKFSLEFVDLVTPIIFQDKITKNDIPTFAKDIK